MADKNFEVSVILGVVNKASAELTKFKKQIDDNKETIQAAGLAMVGFGGSVIAMAGMTVKAAAEQEAAFNRLQKVVELSGASWSQSKGEIDAFIESIQSTTAISDDELAGALQRTITYTGDVASGMRATRIAVDMAGSGMFDLNGATRLVSMAMEGNISALSRMIPELKASNNAQLESMTASEKAEYAIGLLQERFAGMAANELKTTAGLTKNLTKEFGELQEDIGDKLLPAFNSMTLTMTNAIAKVRDFIKENPNLSATIITATTALGGMSLAMGSLLLALPTIVSTVKALWIAIASHPLIAVTAAVSALTLAVLNQAIAEKDAYNAMINTGKSHRDRIALLEEERKKLTDVISDTNASASEREAAENKILAIMKAVKYQEVAAEQEKNAALSEMRDTKNAEDYSALLEKNRAELAESELYYTTITDYQNRLQAAHAVSVQQMQMTWSGAWALMAVDGIKYQTNFYTAAKGMTEAFTSSTASAFAFMIKNIGNGWDILNQGIQKIVNGLVDAVINAATRMAAEWLIQHVIMAGITKLWKAKEISASAAVAGAKAAAASAYLLWGAIAVGLAIGAAVMAFGGAFANGGIVGGSSYSGDNVMARVNSGEMILNKAQQSRLFDIANGSGGGNGGTVVNVAISGNYIMDDGTAAALADKVGDVIMDRVKMERNI